MYLQNLTLKNFRVFSDLDIAFKNGINIISGQNGQGKTSILESIYYLALTRSFRSSNDKNAINHNEDYFSINGKIVIEEKEEIKILLSCSREENKQIYLQKKKIDKFSNYIGKIPCVLLTLDDLKLTMGLPSNRRSFMDILLSQVSSIYLQNLKAYKKIVQHRNKLLNTQNIDNRQLETWNDRLVEYGILVIGERLNFIRFLNENINDYYYKFSKIKEKIIVQYKSFLNQEIDIKSINEIKTNFYDKLKSVEIKEKERKYTLVGPHRDDLIFLKNDMSFKEYGSQGENKTLIIVLKILEWIYVTNQKKKNPIMLLDDIFGELDMSRIKGLLEFLDGIGQSFITTTLKSKFSNLSNKFEIFIKDKKIVYDHQQI